ncbi:uncharacterized protein B0H18DRAFT_636886 [Fomitopsis serialis]|uniref:uncharacterized protein n=1 Tax=Fomitopsis serialis TaxID=139415 RepID=UPI002007B90F|nr:uncharacterized protein B0H18DRAFT_636886 [Neoantrodia serialis]KAH9919421.1 hypothetical protein B0H18DRAFT_636886 [Neoantrodia serialis]
MVPLDVATKLNIRVNLQPSGGTPPSPPATTACRQRPLRDDCLGVCRVRHEKHDARQAWNLNRFFTPVRKVGSHVLACWATIGTRQTRLITYATRHGHAHAIRGQAIPLAQAGFLCTCSRDPARMDLGIWRRSVGSAALVAAIIGQSAPPRILNAAEPNAVEAGRPGLPSTRPLSVVSSPGASSADKWWVWSVWKTSVASEPFVASPHT